MFEHFGIMDIWAGFKRYKTIILTIIIGFLILLVGKFIINSKKSNTVLNSFSNDDIYISTASYYVEPREDMLGRADSNLYRAMPDDYIAMLNTDFCRKYIFDKLLSIYSLDYIVENSGLSKGSSPVNPEEINIDSMKELYQAKKYSSTMLVEISSMTYSKELSDSVRDICEEFILINVDNQITNSTIKLSGEASRVIKSSNISAENIDKNDKRNIVKAPTVQKSTTMSFIKKVIVPMVLIIILCIAVIICMGLACPTINRISDFSEYDVPVIGEIKNCKNIKGIK